MHGMKIILMICLQGVLEGYNSTVFAYGLRGCGKSLSIEGVRNPSWQKGIIPRAFEHIFEAVSVAEGTKYLVLASYLEIYNEEIRDLLGPDVKRKLDFKEHADKGVYVQGMNLYAFNVFLTLISCIFLFLLNIILKQPKQLYFHAK